MRAIVGQVLQLMRVVFKVKELVAFELGIENQLPAIGAYHTLAVVEISIGRLSERAGFFASQNWYETLCSDR